jgi:hypothetical protein
VWRETESCRRPPVENVEDLLEPSTRDLEDEDPPSPRVSRNTSGAFIDEKGGALTADGDDVKRQPAGPRPNVDRRPDASALQSGISLVPRAPSDTYAEEA